MMENNENQLKFISEAISSDLPRLVKILINTNSDIVRNAAALAISDLEGNIYSPNIMEVINKKSVGSKGTLIYALSMMDSEKYFTLIVPFIFSENLEISMEAISFIRKFKSKASLDDLYWTRKIVVANRGNCIIERERKNLLRSIHYEINKRKASPQ